MNAPDESDPYIVLGVKRTASRAQITAAFRRQAKASHPDKHAGKSDLEQNAFEQQFRRVKWAHDILSDAAQRAYYDAHGRTRESAADTPPNRVEETLQNAFREVVGSMRCGEAKRIDLIYKIRLNITDKRIAIRSELSRMKAAGDEVRALEGRFLREGDPENAMSRMLAEDLAKLETVIAARTAEADHLKECLDELQHWKFRTTEEDAVNATVRRVLCA